MPEKEKTRERYASCWCGLINVKSGAIVLSTCLTLILLAGAVVCIALLYPEGKENEVATNCVRLIFYSHLLVLSLFYYGVLRHQPLVMIPYMVFQIVETFIVLALAIIFILVSYMGRFAVKIHAGLLVCQALSWLGVFAMIYVYTIIHKCYKYLLNKQRTTCHPECEACLTRSTTLDSGNNVTSNCTALLPP